MAAADRTMTTLSTKGQVILPKAVRDQLGWPVGARLEVEALADGVVLRRAPLFAPTSVNAVFGSLKSARPSLEIEEMDAGVMAEAKRHAGD